MVGDELSVPVEEGLMGMRWGFKPGVSSREGEGRACGEEEAEGVGEERGCNEQWAFGWGERGRTTSVVSQVWHFLQLGEVRRE